MIGSKLIPFSMEGDVMGQNSGNPRPIAVFAVPDSGLEPRKMCVKIGSEKSPIITCSVLFTQNLATADVEGDLWYLRMIDKHLPVCFPSLGLMPFADLVDQGYVCRCGRHLVYRGYVPSAVFQILELPAGVRFKGR